MPRRREVPKRVLLPDPKYKSPLLAKFINTVMVCGKKSVAEGIVYGALDVLKKKLPNEDPIRVFETAIDNAKPLLQVKSRRVGGATYQVPIEVRSIRRNTLAMRWLIDASRKRGEKSMARRLAGELLDAADSRGAAVKKREDVHRMAEANKAFAHYRW